MSEKLRVEFKIFYVKAYLFIFVYYLSSVLGTGQFLLILWLCLIIVFPLYYFPNYSKLSTVWNIIIEILLFRYPNDYLHVTVNLNSRNSTTLGYENS